MSENSVTKRNVPPHRSISVDVHVVDQKRGVALISVAGCLDAATASSLDDVVNRTAHDGGTRIVFDLGEVFYLSSSGIDCFTNALKTLTPRGGGIVLAGAQERVQGVLQMYGFDEVFPREGSVSAALQHFGTSQAKEAIQFPVSIRCPYCTAQMSFDTADVRRCANCKNDVEIRQDGSISAERLEKSAPGGVDIQPVQVFGQLELIEHLQSGGNHHTHCVSIGNPRSLFGKRGPDNQIPPEIRRSFQCILRLQFYDVEEKRHLRWRQFPKRIPRKSDVRRAIQFFRKTRADATGYTIHCWQGVSRSTAVALGYLYLLTGSETEAKRTLQQIRPEAGPHQKLVQWFDEELGTNLSTLAADMRQERMDRWKAELGML